MIKTPAWRKSHYVRLEEVASDETPVVFAPDAVWAAIRPQAPTPFGESKVTHLVEIDYHPQVTLNTRLIHEETRFLYVRGLQDVEERHITLVLLCEEVLAS